MCRVCVRTLTLRCLLVVRGRHLCSTFLFFFNDTATTEIYTLSLHDALPISPISSRPCTSCCTCSGRACARTWSPWSPGDRKSTRLNSSHQIISYAVFCLKKKNTELSELVSSSAPRVTQRELTLSVRATSSAS